MLPLGGKSRENGPNKLVGLTQVQIYTKFVHLRKSIPFVVMCTPLTTMAIFETVTSNEMSYSFPESARRH